MARQGASSANRRRSWLHDNGLLLACLALLGIFFVGMILAGTATYNAEQREHGSAEQVSVIGVQADRQRRAARPGSSQCGRERSDSMAGPPRRLGVVRV